MLPKMSACRRDFDEAKCMSFLIKHNELLKPNIMTFGLKLAILFKKHLIVNLFAIPVKNVKNI